MLRRQHNFSRGGLLGLLEQERPIMAYCATCDEHWPVAPEQRQWFASALEACQRFSPLV